VVRDAVYSHVIRHIDMHGVCMRVSACVNLYTCVCFSVRTHSSSYAFVLYALVYVHLYVYLYVYMHRAHTTGSSAAHWRE
jgi:hypothetical protein